MNNGKNRIGEYIYHDDSGMPYVLDENGNKRPPMQLPESKISVSGFTYYDISQGHCGLCGRLDCHSNCFKG